MKDREDEGRTWRPGRGVQGPPPRSGTAGGREVECPGQGRDNRSIIEIVVKTQLPTGYTVSPSGACFTSPFFLLAACLNPEKSRIAKKSGRNANVTGFAVVSENRVRGWSAFGYEVAEDALKNDFRYVGEQEDPNSGFYYNRARWMDPGTGRFIGVDPYEGDLQAPASLHRYLYANSSPVSFIDPTGQSLVDVMAALTVVGVLINIGAATYDSFKYLTAVDPVEKNVHLALLVVDLAGLAEGPGGALTGGARVVAYSSEFAIAVSATNSIRGLAGVITNDGFQQWANDIVSYMEGSGDGSNLPSGTKEKVSEILKRKKGSIKGAPLEKGSPSWNEILDLTLEDIIKKAKAREVGFHKFLKLLKDGRFNK